MLIFLASALFAAQATAAPVAAPALPTLTAPQSDALRCGVVFALANRMQTDKKPAAAAWPPLAVRGREYFVRMAAKIIEETGAPRDVIQTLASAQAVAFKDDAAVAAAVPGCLPLLDASGV